MTPTSPNDSSEQKPGVGWALADCAPELVAPSVCACCLAPATLARAERSVRGGSAFVAPYCDACLGHRTLASTRVLAAALASVVLALGLSVLLPLAVGWSSAWVWLASVVGALLPSAVLRLWQPEVPEGHTSWGAAAFFNQNGELVFSNAAFAEMVAAEKAGVLVPRSSVERPSLWVASGAVCVLVVSPFLYWLYHPPVRILNLGDEPVSVWVDGAMLARVEPTSLEHPDAGVKLRVRLGERAIEARALSGKVVDARRVRVKVAEEHLYVPVADGYCFWLEMTHYGRTIAGEPERTALGSSHNFFQIPVGVDNWFSPNPAPGSGDRRSTGGVLTALRQARCRDAPPDAVFPGRF
ncbi:MAG: hypothetical protein SFV15_10790 [Polyangiaceae bacterium]|nr:hypothetical protein [Polyangiaceae bacterium]